jgi:hypothetical protein
MNIRLAAALFVAIIGSSQVHAQATNIFLAQTAAGTADGSSCDNARPVSYFNEARNWGTGGSQIGSGTVVHLCGIIGITLKVPASQGTGLVTIQFEANAKMQQSAAPNFIVLGAHSNSFLVTGQAPCGFVGHAHVDCPEKIQNTDNGSPAGGFGNHISPSTAIDVSGATGTVTIQNLEISNLYVHTDPADAIVANTSIRGVFGNPVLANVTIKNSYIHHTSWAIALTPAAGSGVVEEVAFNDLSDNDHDFSAGDNCSNCYSFVIHDNHSHDHSAWNTASNAYHHDGFHFFNSATQITSGVIYNNLFDGAWDGNVTGPVFDQVPLQNLSVFNNVFICEATCTADPAALWLYGGGVNQLFANNTFIQTGRERGPGPEFHNNATVMMTLPKGMATGNNCFENNVMTSGTTLINTNGPVYAPGCIDYNVYANYVANGNKAFNFDGAGTNAFAAWKSLPGLAGQETHSQYVGDAKLSRKGIPQPGSAVLLHGINLTSLCKGALTPLCTDYDGHPRPASGPWDVGAFQVSGVTP